MTLRVEKRLVLSLWCKSVLLCRHSRYICIGLDHHLWHHVTLYLLHKMVLSLLFCLFLRFEEDWVLILVDLGTTIPSPVKKRLRLG